MSGAAGPGRIDTDPVNTGPTSNGPINTDPTSTGPVNLRVDASDPTPPYEQIRRQLSDMIETGQLAPGMRLATVRQLAGDLGLAGGTVARAYRELEAAGLVLTRRGGGTRVAEGVAVRTVADRLRDHAREYADRARALGVSAIEATAAVAEVWPEPDAAGREEG